MSAVYPRRNLPDEAEPWGRHVEGAITDVENTRRALRMDLDGLNRTTAASLQDLSAQLDKIQALYDAIPKIAQHTSESSGFGLAGGWNSVAGVTVAVPEGAKSAQVTVVTSAYLISSSSSSSGNVLGRITLSGNNSAAIPSAAGIDSNDNWYAALSPTYGWSINVTGVSSIGASLQIAPATTGAWNAGTGSYASVSAFVVFTA